MTEKFQQKYRVSTTRYSYHNYDGGEYFVTICTNGMEHFFGEISNGKMQLSEIGRFVTKQIENISQHYMYAGIPIYVVMPNHVHLMVFIDVDGNNNDRCRDVACNVSRNMTNENNRDVIHVNERMSKISPKSGSLSTVIRGLKSSVTRYCRQNNIHFSWQPRYHDHIIRNQKEMNRIADYIENNVINWELDKYKS